MKKKVIGISACVALLTAAILPALAIQNVWICEVVTESGYTCYIGGTRG